MQGTANEISTLLVQNVQCPVRSTSGLLARNLSSLHSYKVVGALVPGALSGHENEDGLTRIGQVDGSGDGRAAAGDLLGWRPSMVHLGLGRIVALHHRPPASHQNR